MLSTLLLPLLMGMQSVSPPPPTPAPRPLPAGIGNIIRGTYTNEEQVYFERDAGRVPPPFMAVRIDHDGNRVTFRWTPIDAYGAPTTEPSHRFQTSNLNRLDGGGCIRNFTRTPLAWNNPQDVGTCDPMRMPISIDAHGFNLVGPNGQDIRLNRARPFTCWISVRRHADRANGEADWSFDRALPIHDQGGRVLVQPEGAPPVVIRMRNVVWPPPSTNRPSLVLYVHRPETPDRAESYSWADPDARMVGINLRWMQASCTRTENTA